MIHRLLDRLAERYSEGEHKLEAMRAREEYFERAGKVFDDDAELFEGRMASFLEWYVLERPFAGIGLPPVACAHRGGRGAARRRAAGAGARWRPATAACSSCTRSTDQRAGRRGRRSAARASRCTSAATPSGIARGRSVRGARWSGTATTVVFGRTFLFHPARRARGRARLGRARGRGAASARDEILFHLSRQHIRWHRHGHVGAAKVYRDA